jgi:type VI protein secretion system component Hcp
MKVSEIFKPLAIAAPIAAVTTPTADAAYDAFLKIEGVPGESTSPRFTDNSEVLSWSWGVRRNDRDQVEIESFTIVRRVDRASPELLLKVLAEPQPTTITLAMTEFGIRGETNKFFDLTFENISVQEVKIRPAREFFPGDHFSSGSDFFPGDHFDPRGMLEEVTFTFKASSEEDVNPSSIEISIADRDGDGFFRDLDGGAAPTFLKIGIERDGEFIKYGDYEFVKPEDFDAP